MARVQSKAYEIFINERYSVLNSKIQALNPSKVFLLTDEQVVQTCLNKFKEAVSFDFQEIIIPCGEHFKTLDKAKELWQKLMEHNCDRSSLIINLGGGVIGDLGGFVASTYMRGVRFIQVPTTLLAQVDAAIGGKTGINFGPYKNMLGQVSFPELVWMDTEYLRSLSEKELTSGYAEIIKYALIHDSVMWNKLTTVDVMRSNDALLETITSCVKIKEQIVNEDPHDRGIRRILNFGHTVGHALEAHFIKSKRPLTHGEAVAQGMKVEGKLSLKKNRLAKSEFEEIQSHINTHFQKLELIESDIEQVVELMKKDKKNSHGALKVVLLEGIGKSTYDNEVSESEMKEALNLLMHSK